MCNRMTCIICGKKFKSITNTHLKKHNITPEEYKEKYGEITSQSTKNKHTKGWDHTHPNKGKTMEEIIGTECAKIRSEKHSEFMKKNPNNGSFKKGHKPKKPFKKGHEPWNKDKPGCFSEKTLQKMVESHTGKITPDDVREKISNTHTGQHIGKKNNFFGKHHTEKSRQKISANSPRIWLGKKRPDVSGENCHFWNGGKPYNNYCNELYKLKPEIRQRDNYTCQLCNTKENGRRHSVHHIDYDTSNNEKINLISLCHSCHSKTNTNREYWKELFDEFIRKRGY